MLYISIAASTILKQVLLALVNPSIISNYYYSPRSILFRTRLLSNSLFQAFRLQLGLLNAVLVGFIFLYLYLIQKLKVVSYLAYLTYPLDSSFIVINVQRLVQSDKTSIVFFRPSKYQRQCLDTITIASNSLLQVLQFCSIAAILREQNVIRCYQFFPFLSRLFQLRIPKIANSKVLVLTGISRSSQKYQSRSALKN